METCRELRLCPEVICSFFSCSNGNSSGSVFEEKHYIVFIWLITNVEKIFQSYTRREKKIIFKLSLKPLLPRVWRHVLRFRNLRYRASSAFIKTRHAHSRYFQKRSEDDVTTGLRAGEYNWQVCNCTLCPHERHTLDGQNIPVWRNYWFEVLYFFLRLVTSSRRMNVIYKFTR